MEAQKWKIFFFKGKKNSKKAALFYTLSFITLILNVERIARCTQAEDSAAACQLRAGGRRLTF